MNIPIEEVEFKILILDEETPIKGNAMASGDLNQDKQAEDWIHVQLDSGNPWAWCQVSVIARWQGCDGWDVLGCCSYLSEEDFKKGGYYEDMKKNALEDLQNQVDDVIKRGNELNQKLNHREIF